MLPLYDLERRRVDVAPLLGWAHDEVGGPLDELADAVIARALSARLTKLTRTAAVRALLHDIVRAALGGDAPPSLVVQAEAHVRVIVPGDVELRMPFHTDALLGHALDERNLWLPLTPVHGTGRLRALALTRSRALTAPRGEEDRDLWLDAMLAQAGEEPAAIDVDVGEVLLFTPEHVHGASVNESGRARVSLDVRVAPAARTGWQARAGARFVPLGVGA